jgi:hypothetical protein
VRGLAFAVLATACAGCAAREPETLLDREFAAYRLEREERRVADLEAQAAKARAESERLQAELDAANAEIEAKRVRLSDATRARLRLPDAVHVGPPGPPAPQAAAPAASPAAPPVSPPPVPAPNPAGAPR